MNAQPFEYVACIAAGLTAFFIFFQVAIYGDCGKGWIDRPWYIRFFMFTIGLSLIYKVIAFARMGEHFTVGGAVIGYCFCGWQFTSLLYAITQSYKIRSDTITRNLIEEHHHWKTGSKVYRLKA